MIAREWRGETRREQAEAYARYLEETGVAECRATPGNLGVLVLRRAGEEHSEFRFLSLWEGLEAIRAFAGSEVDRARYYPRDPEFLLALEERVAHWEVSAAALPAPTEVD